MPWHIVRLWLLLSLAALLLGVLLAPRPMLADDDLNHAGLIVRDAEGRVTYAWVPFAEEEIDGIALLKRSGIPVVTVGFGALGEGVCSIGGQGCGVSECRRNVCQASAADAPYWQYFQQNPADPAIWTWQPLGASTTDVQDGDVFGWSWTAGDPGLPALPVREIASLAGAGDGGGSTPSVRTLLPDGVAAFQAPPAPEVGTTAAAIAILVLIGGSAVGLGAWRRTLTATPENPHPNRHPEGTRPCAQGEGLPSHWQRGSRYLAPFSLRTWRRAGDESLSHRARPLDPRAWMLWAIAASLPPLLGRNPWPLAATLLAVLGVWFAWSVGVAGARWRPLLRLALFFGAVGVVFNLLTAHVGDLVIGALPQTWPIVGGPLTLNALIYGLLGAVAILALVAVSATLGATLDWSAMMRLLPERMAPLAVAGSIAWSYLPRTVAAFSEIRESQMSRGYRPRGIRDAAPLVIPLLAGGLERSMITAEALEARAFGAPLSPELVPRPWQVVSLVVGLIAALTGAFCLALGQIAASTSLLGLAAVTIAAGLLNRTSIERWLGAHRPSRVFLAPSAQGEGGRGAKILRRTRYRAPIWERPELIVSGAAIAVLCVEIAMLAIDPTAFRYEPYPSLTAPAIDLPLLAALGLLLAPAAVRP